MVVLIATARATFGGRQQAGSHCVMSLVTKKELGVIINVSFLP